MPKTSLLFRVGLAMAIVIMLAVVSMLSSVFIAKNSEGFAAAINQAGTLRMQSYRIASSLVHLPREEGRSAEEISQDLVHEFEERLFSPRIHSVLDKGADPNVHEAYETVESQWKNTMFPQLRTYLEMAQQGTANQEQSRVLEEKKIFFLSNVDGFVQNIHGFVKALELDAETRNRQLRFIQLVALFLTLFVAFVSMFLTKTYLLDPLKDLLACAGAARHGDFSVRSKHLSEDELGQLGAAFNMMAEDLSEMYAQLEARVQKKTADLETSNRSLELLYNTSKRLSKSSPTVDVLEAMIHDIEQAIGIRGGTICLGAPGDDQAFLLASTRPPGGGAKGEDVPGCAACIGDGSSQLFEFDTTIDGRVKLFSTPIRDQQQQYGVLVVELPPDYPEVLEEWKQRLLETVASHIAIAISMSEKASQNRMLSLLEERSVIARELHDSLAQSLSYLKIQVARLDKSITSGEEREQTLEITGVLRKGLNSAYRQLRELLATFRLRISEAGLNAALEDTIREYRERSDIEIMLDNQMANCKFSPNAEIHVIQIIREALSNVTRHANATHARVCLECDINGDVTIIVEDNGIGIDEEHDMMLHYGLPIMKERAEWLGGTLTIGESEEGGTSVKLTFTISETEQTTPHKKLTQRIQHA
jgi:two-component system nitrate/nitrite sensor histidine kinase NarX